MKVYIVYTGDGGDGNEFQVVGVFSSLEKADAFVAANPFNCDKENTEEWEVDKGVKE